MIDAINTFLYDNGSHIRLCVFLAILAVLFVWESLAWMRVYSQNRLIRWVNNIVLIATGSILVYFIFPTAALAVALIIEHNQWGLLNYYRLDYWVKVLIAFVLLDLSLYFQHVMFHALPLFWRFHRVHHCDLDCDASTGFRFHPIEILLSMLIKFLTIAAIGTPILAVFLFEVVLNGMAMFTHANVRLPPTVERIISWIFVTPKMHFIHHSSDERRTNSNFGFNFSFWDKLFGTFVKLPESALANMQIGLLHFRKEKQSLRWLLYLPFVYHVRDYAINRHRRDYPQD